MSINRTILQIKCIALKRSRKFVLMMFNKNSAELILSKSSYPEELKRIAKNGHKKSHKIFNNKLIADFIVRKTMNIKIKSNISWIND